MVLLAALVLGCASGCATGGRDTGGDTQPVDAALGQDASQLVPDAPRFVDASVPIDAPPVVVIDAPPPPPPDAPPSSLFCTANNQCTNPGECCLTLGGPMGFCAPGTVVFGQCFPIE